MNDNFNQDFDYDSAEERRRIRRQKRKRQVAIQRAVFLIVFVLIIGAAVFIGSKTFLSRNDSPQAGSSSVNNTQTGSQTETNAPIQTETPAAEPVTESEAETSAPAAPVAADSSVLEQARLMAMGYDYDGAIELLKTVPSYEADPEITAAISDFEATKASCVAVDVNTVPHIFYHSLLNDTDRAFNVSVLGQGAVDGMNAWMTTIEEFDKITQTMYDNGYVFVRLRDLVVESTDENGNVSFTPNTNLLLPPGKKAVVLSVDDLSYYHSYEPAGFPDKLILDENGDVKCHYVTADGTEQVGDFDVVPRLNTFLKEHPDGAYKGARGLIALTGYNGVFGYRTDSDYETRQNLLADQSKWLEEHPDFNRQTEIDEAITIANALKEDGWEFASHTWGHLSVTGKTVDELRIDNEKWVNNVQNIVGPVDTIIFAHGNDIGDWQGYSSDNEKYAYFKSAGYNFFCNVDSSQPYWVQITSDYVRQGRIDLDGYLLYKSSQGGTTVLDNMFLASQVFDSRRPTPVVANGES
ncbi:MAG: polysaccharide deacetylase [Lachnospiraceae bacterium]|nr:polysaccharide deacetylase [Lachnospiraceae bacterium]